MRAKTVRRLLGSLGIGAATILFLVVILGPILWLVWASFQPERNLLSAHPALNLRDADFSAYREIFAGAFSKVPQVGVPYPSRIFLRSLLNSTIVAFSVSLFSVGVGSYAAYSLARLEFRGRSVLLFSFLGARLIPSLAIAVPFYLMIQAVNMLDNLGSIIVADLFFSLPYAVWLMRSYFLSIPMELEDAARIDGCGRFQVVNRIILPLAAPGLASAAIVTFMITWGEFFYALILSSSEASYTNTVVASMFVTDVDVKYTRIITAGVLSIVPPVMLALALQRFIVQGLTSGGVKE
jgi:ABC-type sugar transport system, permease component